MTTSIYKYDGNLLVSLKDYTLNVTNSPLSLPGRGYRNYDAPVAQNLLWTLQSFARNVAPNIAIQGQVWYDTTVNALRVNNGNLWSSNNGVILSGDQPVTATNPGTFWYDTYNLQLNVWNDNNWNLIGPVGSAANSDPVSNTTTPSNSKTDAVQISDAFGNNHEAFRITIDGILLAIVSKDAEYTPSPGINGFATISPGINLNSLIVLPNEDLTIFRSTQSNYPDSDGHRNLGSPSLSFNDINANIAVISNQMLVNTYQNNYNFEINGNSYLNGNTFISKTATFSSGTSTMPPLIINSGNLLTSNKSGAFEFDGQNLYITTAASNVLTRQTIGLGIPVPPGTWGWTITNATPNLYIATYNPNQSLPIIPGSIITAVIPNTNTSTSVTLKVNSASASNVLLADGITSPPVGSLISGHVVQFEWNGVNWLFVADLTNIGKIGGSSYLPLSGGNMTGFPVLPGNPILNLQAAPMQYVDQQFSNINNEISLLNSEIGKLNINAYLPLSGGTMTGFPVLPGNPPLALQAAPKQYVDEAISSLNLSSYLQLSGGSMTGPLTLNADPTTPLGAVTKQYIDNNLAVISGGLVKRSTFITSSTTYKNNGNRMLIIITGGGGGGGSGGPGGGAQTFILQIQSQSTTTYPSFQVTIGAGGVAGDTGSAGGPTSFGSIVSVYSGNGGKSTSGKSGANPSGSTIVPSGTVNNSGGYSSGISMGSNSYDGTSFWGDAGLPNQTATVYGAGGGINGNGAPGVILIMEIT